MSCILGENFGDYKNNLIFEEKSVICFRYKLIFNFLSLVF